MNTYQQHQQPKNVRSKSKCALKKKKSHFLLHFIFTTCHLVTIGGKHQQRPEPHQTCVQCILTSHAPKKKPEKPIKPLYTPLTPTAVLAVKKI
jgi:hypothetical protein